MDIDQQQKQKQATDERRERALRNYRGSRMYSRAARDIVIGIALVALGWWLLQDGNAAGLLKTVRSSVRPLVTITVHAEPTPAPSPAPPPPHKPPAPRRASVAMAVRQLKEIAPYKYEQVSNLNSPRVTPNGSNTTFTWEYVTKTDGHFEQVHEYSITLSPDGKVRGVTNG